MHPVIIVGLIVLSYLSVTSMPSSSREKDPEAPKIESRSVHNTQPSDGSSENKADSEATVDTPISSPPETNNIRPDKAQRALDKQIERAQKEQERQLEKAEKSREKEIERSQKEFERQQARETEKQLNDALEPIDNNKRSGRNKGPG